jgi:hypothetical protein
VNIQSGKFTVGSLATPTDTTMVGALTCRGLTSTLTTQANTTAKIFNEEDGGGTEIINTLSGTTTFCGVNSDGTNRATEDFVELYSKNTSSGTGSRVYITSSGIGLNANSQAPATIADCRFYLSDSGLLLNTGLIVNGIFGNDSELTISCATLYLQSSTAYGTTTITVAANNITLGATTTTANGNFVIGNNGTSYTLTLNGTQIGGSNTITHKTNIINYNENQIGTFCETTGEVADVYGIDYIPTLDRATDAIVRVKQSTTLNSKIIGIITKNDTFMSHGDVLCRVVLDTYSLGDILTADESGLMRKANEQDKLFMLMNSILMPKITALFLDKDYCACFIQ